MAYFVLKSLAIKACENPRLMVKLVLKLDGHLLRYQRIASKIFSMLNILLQAIEHILNVLSHVICEQVTCLILATSVKGFNHHKTNDNVVCGEK